MSDEKGVWGWVGKLNNLIALLVALAGIAGSVLTYFFGVTHGETNQLTTTLEGVDQLEKATPPSLKERMAPIYAAIRAAATNGTGSQSPAAISQQVRNITNAVTGIPTSTFSIGTSRAFAVPEHRTAFVCGDRFHLGYGGLGSYVGQYVVYMDQEQWTAKIGTTNSFKNGVQLTLMQVENKTASFDIACPT